MDSKFQIPNSKFPHKFYWGAGTSAHQVEGNNINSDWWQFEQTGHIKNGDVSGAACDHWHRFREDFALAKELGHNAHRFSIEWTKIEPHQGHWDENAIEHYRQVFASLKENGLEPFPTLWHFTLPQWVAEKGGWNNPKIVGWFGEYVKKVVKEMNFVGHWITLNEPSIYLAQKYFNSVFPNSSPLWELPLAANHFANAHKKAYHILKGFSADNSVGLAYSIIYFDPLNNGWSERLACTVASYFANDWFINKIKNNLDWFALNYYFRFNIGWLSVGKFIPQHIKTNLPKNDRGWDIYPKGIYQAIKLCAKFNKPIIITENGLADAADTRREAFIIHHIEQMKRAMRDGYDVRGYLHWSLLDNFEWEEGYGSRFGLVEVDYNTQKRTPRPSAWVYKKIIKASSEF